MRAANNSPSDPSAPGNAQDCADHSQSHSTARASSSGARAISPGEKKFDKLGQGNGRDAAIARAKGAFMAARTVYARRKAMRKLEDLGVTIGGKK